MLHWVGKRPLERVTAYRLQLVRLSILPVQGLQAVGCCSTVTIRTCWPGCLPNGYRGKVDLIYIDPPFDSGADYVRQVQLRVCKSAKIGWRGA
jgi:16S rRNA G966 N2-methylase RsmD